jgi:hypothetical protein
LTFFFYRREKSIAQSLIWQCFLLFKNPYYLTLAIAFRFAKSLTVFELLPKQKSSWQSQTIFIDNSLIIN